MARRYRTRSPGRGQSPFPVEKGSDPFVGPYALHTRTYRRHEGFALIMARFDRNKRMTA